VLPPRRLLRMRATCHPICQPGVSPSRRAGSGWFCWSPARLLLKEEKCALLKRLVGSLRSRSLSRRRLAGCTGELRRRQPLVKELRDIAVTRLRFAGDRYAMLLKNLPEELSRVLGRIINGKGCFHPFIAERNRSPKQHFL